MLDRLVWRRFGIMPGTNDYASFFLCPIRFTFEERHRLLRHGSFHACCGRGAPVDRTPSEAPHLRSSTIIPSKKKKKNMKPNRAHQKWNSSDIGLRGPAIPQKKTFHPENNTSIVAPVFSGTRTRNFVRGLRGTDGGY